jgi:serine/threonine protein kinase
MQVVAPLLQVLVRLHIDRIVHRDIKPENLFLTRKRQLKLGDLGLAIVAAEELPFTRSGTLDYMAPEVMTYCRPIDCRMSRTCRPRWQQRDGTLHTRRLHVRQVLANPSAELQEAPGVTREQLRECGIRPYDEKVRAPAVQSPCASPSRLCASHSCFCSAAAHELHEGLATDGHHTW